jgi:hypothetical protein
MKRERSFASGELGPPGRGEFELQSKRVAIEADRTIHIRNKVNCVAELEFHIFSRRVSVGNDPRE